MAIPFSLYVYEYLSMKKATKKAPFVFVILCLCANIVFLTVQYITAWFVLLDANNNYDPQGLTALVQILPTIMPMLCYVIEDIFKNYLLWITYFGVSVVLLLLYINIQVELGHMLIKKEAELTESRVAVMLSQIQPHFLYNTLGTIDKLYFENAEEEHNAIVKFSSYLRNSMEILSLIKNEYLFPKNLPM